MAPYNEAGFGMQTITPAMSDSRKAPERRTNARPRGSWPCASQTCSGAFSHQRTELLRTTPPVALEEFPPQRPWSRCDRHVYSSFFQSAQRGYSFLGWGMR
jgi:hypothetical protein